MDIEKAFLGETPEEIKKRKKETIGPILINFLDNLKIMYDEVDIDNLCEKYDGELTAFLLGESMYSFKRSYRGENAGKNDYIDIKHLLYIRNENDIIVSDDDIYSTTTIFQQRKSVDEFKKRFNI